MFGEAQPEHVHRCAEFADLEPGSATDRPILARPPPTVRSARTSTGPSGVCARTPTTRPSLLRAPRRACIRKVKCRITLGLPGEKIQKVPLRHEGDELAAHREMREVGDFNLVSPTRRASSSPPDAAV